MDPLPRAVAWIERPAVDELFETAARQRICVLIGAPGWGKSTAVASWARLRRVVWLGVEDHGTDPDRLLGGLREALERQVGVSAAGLPAMEPRGPQRVESAAAAVAGWLHGSPHEDIVLVLDDLQCLPPGSDSAHLVEALCRRAPAWLHIVLISRRELPFSLTRLRGQGLVAEIQAPDLAFDVPAVAALLRATVGEHPSGLATLVWKATGGWPAALHCAVELLRGVAPDQRADMLNQLTRPGERFHSYLAEEVIGPEPAVTREFLHRVSVFGEVGPTMGAASTFGAGAGAQDTASLLSDLTRRGLLRQRAGGTVRWRLLRPVADYFAHEGALGAGDRMRVHGPAAWECLERGAYAQAVRHLVAARDHRGCAEVLIEHGGAMVNGGQVDAVLLAAELPPEYLADPRIQRVLGDARQVRGEWTAARESFQRAAGHRDELEPALAWRVCTLAFAQGEFPEVLALFARTRLAREDTVDEARVLAWAAAAQLMVGDLANLRTLSARGLAAARRSGDPRAKAAVYHVLAMLAAGEADRRQTDAHYATALANAELAGDLVQVMWIRACRALRVLEHGAPRQALADAQIALQLSEKWEIPFLIAHTLTTRGRAQLRLGMLDAAHADFTSAVDLFQRLGSRFLAWPLCGLGDLHRLRGQLVRARAAYEEALALAEPCHDVLGLSSALIGLARTRASDDTAVARAYAERAIGLAADFREVPAYLTRGWIALLDGNRAAAAADAAQAAADARRRRDNLGLAEAITLAVLADPDPDADAGLLAEAIDIWQESGCRIEEAITRLVAARIGTTPPGAASEQAAATLRDCGLDPGARRGAGPLGVLAEAPPAVAIHALGVFRVTRNGIPIAKTAWQSRKARDLLKILVARRRPTPREHLLELLWPEADPAKSGNRLSVLLTTVRDVLQPATGEPQPLTTDGSAVWLDPALVSVDVEDFLAIAARALDAHRGRHPDAGARLTAAAAAHTGAFLEDDPYPDWAQDLTEEVRATHLAVLRALITHQRAAGDVDDVVRHTLRLLEQDPYDERAHLDLVTTLLTAGHLGEAHRRYRIYTQQMTEIGIEARPMPPHPSRQLTRPA